MGDPIPVASGPIEPGSIRWLTGEPPIGFRCAVCGDAGPHAPILEVPELVPPHRPLRLIRCRRCESAFYDRPEIRDFSDLGQQGDHFWRFYLEVGGGLWETIWPMSVRMFAEARSLLDVGCGFGFALDFWRSATGGEAEGVELADYGRIGAEMLGLTIHRKLLQECSELVGRRFDIVYASEVIEHVPDPGSFVSLLATFVADDGMLVLTTPCASHVERSNQSATLLAALAPGFHGFLLSPAAFADAARRAGFAYVDVHRYGERMVLWAARRPLATRPNPEKVRPSYFRYLEERCARNDDTTPLWRSYAYRYLRDTVNTGRWPEAKSMAIRLTAELVRAFGADIVQPEILVKRLAGACSLEAAGCAGPFFLPSLLYFLGRVAHHVDRDAASAERLYAGAAAAIVACARLEPLFYLEAISLLWPARRAAAQMQLARGETAKAVRALVEIAETANDAGPQNGYSSAESGFVEATLAPVIDGLRARGQVEFARVLADARDRSSGPAIGTSPSEVSAPASTKTSTPIVSFETTFTIKQR